MSYDVIQVDYQNPQHADWLIYLLDHYARDEQGGGQPLSDYAREYLSEALSKQDGAVSFVLLAGGSPAALANCFFGFSTFKCKPLLNIHDFVVHKDYRGKGLSQLLLESVERLARERGCCKVTLEVLEGNKTAQHAYSSYGFSGYELDPKLGKAMFWERSLD